MSFGSTVATFGSALIALGVAWLIAQNWHVLPAAVKILILMGATAGAFYAGVELRIRKYNVGTVLIVLGGLLYTLSIFLIAQIFSTDASMQGTAFLLLLSWLGVAASSYIFASPWSLAVALCEFLLWVVVQASAFDASLGIIALAFLSLGLVFFGLSAYNKGKPFERVYQIWTVFYFLAFTYLLSFQHALPRMWAESPGAGAFFFVIILAALGIIGGGIGFPRVEAKERIGVLAIVGVLFLLIILTGLASSDVGVCQANTCNMYTSREACADTIYGECAWDERGWCLLAPDTSIDCTATTEETCSKEGCNWKASLSEQCSICTDASCERNFVKCRASQYEDRYDCRTFFDRCWEEGMTKDDCVAELETCDVAHACVPKAQKIMPDIPDTCKKYDAAACAENTQCRWQDRSYWSRENVPGSIWLIWTLINVAFIGIILTFIGYGTWKKNKIIINLGIFFFGLDIITRYIGFIMDLWGYMSLSFVFIGGGILLIVGGWYIEKWRRKLIENAKN